MSDKYRVRVLNNISAGGLKRLPWDRFAVSADVDDPHAILLRSADLHGTEISESLLAVGRAGSGTNNIPVPAMSASLAYFDSYRTARLPQNLTQAQRDYFGAHTYQRVDAPDEGFVHTDWDA